MRKSKVFCSANISGPKPDVITNKRHEMLEKKEQQVDRIVEELYNNVVDYKQLLKTLTKEALMRKTKEELSQIEEKL